MPDIFLKLLAHLMRGGNWSYWWIKTAQGVKSIWWKAGAPVALPTGAVNVYFGIHPTANKRAANERARLNDIAAVNVRHEHIAAEVLVHLFDRLKLFFFDCVDHHRVRSDTAVVFQVG